MVSGDVACDEHKKKKIILTKTSGLLFLYYIDYIIIKMRCERDSP